jgi:hypothetical protein
MNEFKTTHNLTFYDAPDHGHLILDMLFPKHGNTFVPYRRFKIGTCHGLWNVESKTYNILAIINDEPGNGHLEDVFEYFENSARRDNHALKILEVWNKSFETHLINKRGFKKIKTGCIKYFN